VEGRSGLFEGDECLKIVRTHQKHWKRHKTAGSSHTEQCREGRYSCGDDGVELPPSARAQRSPEKGEKGEKGRDGKGSRGGHLANGNTHTHTPTHPHTWKGWERQGGGAGHCIVEETVGCSLSRRKRTASSVNGGPQLRYLHGRTTHSLPQCDRHHNTGDAARQQWLSGGEGSSEW
jgi:hypothetical protein